MQNYNQYSVIYPPNRPMEEVITQPNCPLVGGFNYFIDFNSRGELVMGTSDVCGTGWYGAVVHFKSFEQAALSLSNYASYHLTESTTGNGVFVNDTHVLAADDSKLLALLTLPENETDKLMCGKDTFETEAITESLAVWKNHSKAVISCGTSISTIALGNQPAFKPLNIYENYHTERVTSVDADKNQPNIFVSSSVDRKVCMWDDRISELLSILYVNEFSAMKEVACHPLDTNLIIAGSDAGDVYLLDKREPKQFVTVYNCFDNQIHRLKFSDSEKLAVCGDNTDVVVLSCNEGNLKPLYISQAHKDIVRGLAWWKDDLYSCGYDNKCLKHVI